MITKRQLGLSFIGLGLAGVLATLAVDWLRAGEFSGVGPLQRAALLGGIAAVLIGLSLLPLGDRPA